MAKITLAETTSPVSTPSTGKVSLFADTTANPQLRFIDDAGNNRQLADTVNTMTMAGKTFTAPVLGAATGTSVAVTGTLTSSGTAGIGYATGAGGAVTQATSKNTTFTLNKTVGTIQFAADALAADTTVASTWTNSTIAANDVVVFTHSSGGTLGAYNIACTPGAGSATINLRNITPGSLSEAPIFRFVVIKGVVA